MNIKKETLVIILVVVFVGGYFLLNKNNDSSDDELVACTQEAKQCPDGSYVGRTGPNCEFTECPIVQDKSIDISDWQTYRNEEFGFEFKHPTLWVISESNNNPVGENGRYYSVEVISPSKASLDPSKPYAFINSSNFDIIIFHNPNDLFDGYGSTTEEYVKNGPFYYRDETTLNTYPAWRYRYGGIGTDVEAYIIARNNKMYVLSIQNKSIETDIPIQNKILSTFKFIE